MISLIIISYPILSYHILSYLILSYLVLSYLVMSLPYPTLPYTIQYYTTLYYLFLSYRILSYSLTSYPILSYLILSCPNQAPIRAPYHSSLIISSDALISLSLDSILLLKSIHQEGSTQLLHHNTHLYMHDLRVSSKLITL